MKIIDASDREVTIENRDWPLVEQLFYNWGYGPNFNNEIKVTDIADITPELSAWGIPWKRNDWGEL